MTAQMSETEINQEAVADYLEGADTLTPDQIRKVLVRLERTIARERMVWTDKQGARWWVGKATVLEVQRRLRALL